MGTGVGRLFKGLGFCGCARSRSRGAVIFTASRSIMGVVRACCVRSFGPVLAGCFPNGLRVVCRISLWSGGGFAGCF